MEVYFGGGLNAVSGALQARGSRTTAASGRRENAVRRFDSVSIGGASGNNSFALALKSRLTQEVRASTTPGRLSALREQVQGGAYQPDPTSIARHMLLMVEEA